jgi:tetratricopeptide (TPR) repeat protein
MLGSRIAFYGYSILILSILFSPAFAEENIEDTPIVLVDTDKLVYKIGDSMIVSGLVEEKKMPVVALSIYNPDGGIISANQIDLEDDDTFSKIISLDSPLFEKTGTYSIKIDYGKLKAETNFDLISETPNENEEIIPEIEEFNFPEVIVITDKASYQDGDTVVIVGFVSVIHEPSVLIGIYDPFGFPAGFYFGDVNSNFEFSVDFLVKEGVNFKTEGEYSVIARYGNSEDKITFNFVKQVETTEPVEDVPLENEQNKEYDETNDDSSSDLLVEADEKPNNVIEKPETEIEKIVEQKIENIIVETKTPVPKPDNKNLSVEDIELGKLLNRINLNCDNSEYTDIISYYDGMGPALMRLCKYNAAISFYDQSLIENPKRLEAIINKGSALTKLGYFEEAIMFYDSAIDIDSNNIMALNNKANALSSLGNYNEAISFYNKAIQLDPDNSIIITNLEKSQGKILLFPKENVELIPLHVETTNEIKSSEITNNKQDSNFLNQISSVFSSLSEAFFGFLS